MPPSRSHQTNANSENSSPQTSEGSNLFALSGSGVSTSDGEAVASKPGEAAAIAEAINRAGIAGPVSIALRIASPLSWLGGQMLWAVQPLLQGLRIGPGSSQRKGKGLEGMVPRLATFLEGEGNIAELITHLEAKSGVQSPKSKVKGPKPASEEYAIRNTQYFHTSHPSEGGEDGPA